MSKNDYLPKDPDDYENQKRIQKMKFCIITNFRPEIRKLNLMLFALDNVY